MTTPEATIEVHLRAIADRDLAAYTATLHADVTLVLPNGTVHSGRDEVVAFHREFFADTGWRQRFTPLRRVVTRHAVSAVYDVDYDGSDADDTPRHSRFLVTLVFVPDGERWLLVHDQCTPLPTGRPAPV